MLLKFHADRSSSCDRRWSDLPVWNRGLYKVVKFDQDIARNDRILQVDEL